MKNFLITSLVAIMALMAHAQDVIVKKDGSTILSSVIEVSGTEVKYKKHSNPKGPTYTIMVSELISINYQNGDKDTFDIPNPSKSQDAPGVVVPVSSTQQPVSNQQPVYNQQVAQPMNNVQQYNGYPSPQRQNEPLISEFYDNNNHSIDWMIQDLESSARRRNVWGNVFCFGFLGLGIATWAATDNWVPGAVCLGAGIFSSGCFFRKAAKYEGEANRLKSLNEFYSYSPILYDNIELGHVSISPSIGYTADNFSRTKSPSLGITLNF